MLKFARTLVIMILSLGTYINVARAAIAPLSVAIVPPVQFPPSDFTVTGLRLSALWGHHRDLYGIDIGALGNITDQDFAGIGLSGLFNITTGTTRVILLQAAGIGNFNTNKTSIYGLQIALGINFNKAQAAMSGLQLALINLSSFTDIYGFQIGLYNTALNVYGIQLGVINVTQSLHGIQIGLMNFHEKGLFKVSPILNIGF